MGHHCCNKQKIKRALWSPEEDEKLIKYITTHGHASWSSLPKLAGLQRCGKSCRLRWINYLRPDLKRGSFSAQEESIIIDVHRILGNRWAQIAKHLPGRTDNEVKNFWNSCIKKKLLAQGLDPNTHSLLSSNTINGSSSSDIYNGKSTSCKLLAGSSCTDSRRPTFSTAVSAALGNNDCYLVDIKPPFLITTPATASSVPAPPPPPPPPPLPLPHQDGYYSQSFSTLHQDMVSSILSSDQSIFEDQNYCNMQAVGTIREQNIPIASKESSTESVLPYSFTSSYHQSAVSFSGQSDYCTWEYLDDIAGSDRTFRENEALLILQMEAAYAATSGNIQPIVHHGRAKDLSSGRLFNVRETQNMEMETSL